MDNQGDSNITFLDDGTCNYCNYAIMRMPHVYFPNEVGEKLLQKMLNQIKQDRKKYEYDCIMGISGGLDSAYLAYLGSKKWGLRILGIHVDDGFDTEAAIMNIEAIRKNCGIQIINIAPNKEQFMDLTRSFFLAGVSGICNPQDNILVAALFSVAKKYKIKHFLSGTNFALESILQRSGGHIYADDVNIRDIHKKFGTISISDLRLISIWERYFIYKYFHGLKYLRPLDLIEYHRDRAILELESIGFKYYEGKHYESVLTRFTQVYYLPKKFNIDIRKSHISSLIVSGQITREEALNEISKPLYVEKKIEEDINYILENLRLSRKEFEKIMNEPAQDHTHFKYSIWIKFINIARKYRKYLSD
jgi:N-acetyl sugar amidotransferase